MPDPSIPLLLFPFDTTGYHLMRNFPAALNTLLFQRDRGKMKFVLVSQRKKGSVPVPTLDFKEYGSFQLPARHACKLQLSYSKK